MRLSDAIALGRTLVTRCVAEGSTGVDALPGDGCVLDMAVLAVGGSKSDFAFGDWRDARIIWKWLNEQNPRNSGGETYEGCIYTMFDGAVMRTQEMTLDQLIDWVRSVEPAEAEESAASDSMVLPFEDLVTETK